MTEVMSVVEDVRINEAYNLPVVISVGEPVKLGDGAITAPEFSAADAKAEAEQVADSLVWIDWRNPAVCIDGRHLAPGEIKLALGAHLSGGAETLLVAARSTGYHLEGKELIARAKELGFTLGGHDADTNKAHGYENGTGCGACDKCQASCDSFTANKMFAKDTVAALLGSDFDSQTYDSVNLVPVEGRLSDVVGDELIETLHDDNEGVHGHKEQMVIFNYVEDTTIDRDAYFEKTGKQVFVVDMWYLKKLAVAMGSDEQQSSELYHAMVDFQVAVYLGLCDGSHRPVIVQPDTSV